MEGEPQSYLSVCHLKKKIRSQKQYALICCGVACLGVKIKLPNKEMTEFI